MNKVYYHSLYTLTLINQGLVLASAATVMSQNSAGSAQPLLPLYIDQLNQAYSHVEDVVMECETNMWTNIDYEMTNYFFGNSTPSTPNE